MKNAQKFLLMLLLAVGSLSYSASAQVFVTVRPPVPHYVRVERPSPRHVWIDEEWEPRGSEYAFVGGHWAEPPRPRAVWIGGHWKHGPRGDYWKPGHWR